jgi:hypothetical protein
MATVFLASTGIAFATVIVLAAAADPGLKGTAAPNAAAPLATAPEAATVAAAVPNHLLPLTATGLAGAPPGSPPMERRTRSGCCWSDDD